VSAVHEPATSEALWMALSNATLLASAATIASMLVAYILCIISARKMVANFSLRKLESVELDRAVLLYEKVFDRLQEIYCEGEHAEASLLARYKHRKKVSRKFAEELADLQAYASHIRSTIIRLRCRPIQRFKSWLHINSSRFALSRSLASCFLVLAMLIARSYLFEQHILFEQRYLLQQVSAEAMDSVFEGFLAWQPFVDRMLSANPIGAGFIAVVTPVFYFYRRLKLRREHARQFRRLKQFAGTDPDRLIHQAPIGKDMPDETVEVSTGIAGERTWSSVLGVSPSATIDEVKQAYKVQVKQNHPDRVHDMSPLFRELAEAETKKLNAAYEEALMSLQRL
jgi:DnaJ-like protein